MQECLAAACPQVPVPVVRLRESARLTCVRLVLSVLIAVVRAVASRLLLAAVFGAIALLLAQQVAGAVVERLGTAPAVTPMATPAAGQR